MEKMATIKDTELGTKATKFIMVYGEGGALSTASARVCAYGQTAS
jgi:hypothetical protein